MCWAVIGVDLPETSGMPIILEETPRELVIAG